MSNNLLYLQVHRLVMVSQVAINIQQRFILQERPCLKHQFTLLAHQISKVYSPLKQRLDKQRHLNQVVLVLLKTH